MVSEKLLRELANFSGMIRTTSTPGGRNWGERMEMEMEMEGQIEVLISEVCSEQHRGLRHETDSGGVRLLGGGRPGVATDDFDQQSISEVHALPPPYSSVPASGSGGM